MYDLLILGGGVAGLSAAIYAARAQLNFLLLEQGLPGGQALETAEIENYPGVPNTTGAALSEILAAQATALGAPLRTATVTGWERQVNGFAVHLRRKEPLLTRSLLIATGATHRPLEVPGEEMFRGKGVSYCATCDGRFFRDKTVAVVGGGNTAAEEALYLSNLCQTVYLIHRRDTLRADRTLQARLAAAENIHLRLNTTVCAILGGERVESLALNGESDTLPVDGVFIAVGIRPNTALFSELPQDENGFLLADESGQTALPGVFAAGDVRAKSCRQLITAAADGAAAITAINRYLQTLSPEK